MNVFFNQLTERNDNMSFVGLFKSNNGIVAFADSKSTLCDVSGNLYEEVGRNPKKVFKSQQFIFVTFGTNTCIENKADIYIETLLDRCLQDFTGSAIIFFEKVYRSLQETFDMIPDRTYFFIYGEKEKDKYCLYSIFINKDGIHYENIVKTTDNIYNIVPMTPLHLSIEQSLSIKEMKEKAHVLVSSVITLGDTFLKYNPIGGDIQLQEFQ